MRNNVHKIRGQVIDYVIELERDIDMLIAMHYCHDSNMALDLAYSILSTNRITFEAKRQVLKNICERWHTYNFDKQFFKDLQSVIEERNVLAHYKSTGYADENVYAEFIKYNNYPEKKQYSYSELTGIISLILKLLSAAKSKRLDKMKDFE